MLRPAAAPAPSRWPLDLSIPLVFLAAGTLTSFGVILSGRMEMMAAV